jgi:GntR family transcriptional repressor for pyruvate dehydrogenase complex
MVIQPAQKITLIESVTEQLLALIRDGHLKPGDALPSERELMEQLHVGRSSVREALRNLATMRVIEVRPGRGAFVRTPLSADLVPSHALRALIHRDAMMEIVEAREVLEVEMAAMAAERAGADDLARIAGILAAMEQAIGDPEESLALNARFHLAVAEAAHNAVLLKMLRSVRDYLDQQLREMSQSEQLMRDALAGHHHIYACIRTGERACAADAMRGHLGAVRRQVQTEV